MNIFFIHQNFPAQFKSLAPALAKAGHTVSALTMRDLKAANWNGVRIIRYKPSRGSTPGIHPWVVDLETKIIRAEAVLEAAQALHAAGLRPDVIVAHPGWGESLFLKDVWPGASLGIYCEYFYGPDTDFDPEFNLITANSNARTRLKNLYNLLQFPSVDAGISPTRWQAETYPTPMRERISIIHDGIDTHRLQPSPETTLTLGNGTRLDADSEVITYVARSLEPYRGFHTFMRALPEILKRRSHAQVLIVGAEGQSYGPAPTEGASWMQMFTNEVRGSISDADWSRVHFLGQIPYDTLLSVLQRSTVHVYMTYPFVLSWSLLEAMSIGCAVVGSDTGPVREVIAHEDTGLLVDFFDASALADAVDRLAQDATLRKHLGVNARAQTIARYDLASICLPAQLRWVESLRP